MIPLLERYFPNHVQLYQALRFPTAKSDVARYLLLHEVGGLYVDCHCGIRDVDEIRRLLASLGDVEAVFIDRILSFIPRPPEEHFLLSSIIFSQLRSSLVLMACRQALTNLAWHRQQQREKGHFDYSLYSLCGPKLITAMVLQPGSFNRDIRWDFAGRIKIIPEEIAPIVRNRHRSYGGPGQHWSERQKVELLFDS